MMKHILFLTSTIQPKSNQPSLALIDPIERLKDYRKALVFYQSLLLEGVISHVVYVDNSGYDLSVLSQEFTHPGFEWISFKGLDYPSHYHRGYGEFNLIDYGFLHSDILKKMDASDKVWKVTGRYIVENLAAVLKFSPPAFDLYCNQREHWVDMELLAWSKHGHTHFVHNLWQDFATDKAPELILAEKLNALTKGDQLHIVNRFFWIPRLVGRRGTDGGAFQSKYSDYKLKLKLLAKFVMLPWNYLCYFIKK